MTEMVEKIFNEAVRMEDEGINFYEDLAENVNDDQAENVFLALASDEKRHRKIFIEMRDSILKGKEFEVDWELRLRPLPMFKELEAVIEKKKSHRYVLFDQRPDLSAVDALSIALKMETMAVAHYRRIQEMVSKDAQAVTALDLIIAEEVIHHIMIDAQTNFLREKGFFFKIDTFDEFRKTTEPELRAFLDENMIPLPDDLR